MIHLIEVKKVAVFDAFQKKFDSGSKISIIGYLLIKYGKEPKLQSVAFK
jgi:hypothetical protein